LDLLDISNQIAPLVLHLAASARLSRWAFRCRQKLCRTPPPHLPQDLRIVRDIDRRLRVEGIPAALRLPLDQRRKELRPRRFLIPHQIIVDEKDRRPPPRLPQAIQLGDDLTWRLDARLSPEQRGHIAKIAIKRAPARVLHSHEPYRLKSSRFHIGMGDVFRSANSALV